MFITHILKYFNIYVIYNEIPYNSTEIYKMEYLTHMYILYMNE